jgi:drug/metabolite transporter (DMT)-like permease
MPSSHNDYRMLRKDWLLLLFPGLIWGSSFFFIAEGLDAFQPALITPLRVLFGFLALIALPQSRKHIPIEDLPSIALLGVFWMVIPLSLFPFAEQHVSSSVTGNSLAEPSIVNRPASGFLCISRSIVLAIARAST